MEEKVEKHGLRTLVEIILGYWGLLVLLSPIILAVILIYLILKG